MQFDEIQIDDTITVRHLAAHTGETIHVTTGTVKRKYTNSIHLVNSTTVNDAYELIKRDNIIEII